MNNENESQVKDLIIRSLVAQSKYYDKAKRYSSFCIFIAVVVAAISIGASWANNETFTAVNFLILISSLLAIKFIDKYSRKNKKIGAEIQQFIDATLYNKILGINDNLWGKVLDFDEVEEFISEIKITEKDIPNDNDNDWYSNYSNLSPVIQVLNCQKENARWSMKLVNRYAVAIIILMIIMVVVLFASIKPSSNLIHILNVVSWTLPLIEIIITYIKLVINEKSKMNKNYDEIKEIGRDIKIKLSENNISEAVKSLILIQDKIYDQRLNGMLIPNWIYRIFKEKDQKKEDELAKHLNEGGKTLKDEGDK